MVYPFLVSLTFYCCSFPAGTFPYMGKNIQNFLLQTFCHYFICIATLKSLQSSRIFLILLCHTPVIEMPSLNRDEKVTCDNCGTQTTKLNPARLTKRCSVGTLYCTQCPNFSTKVRIDLNYHIAKKHSAPKLDVTSKCKLCHQEFPGFYALRQHRNTQH